MPIQKINNKNNYINKFYTNYFSINKNYIKCKGLIDARQTKQSTPLMAKDPS